jgi:CPA1 family monovalent cation:H+ antiporter
VPRAVGINHIALEVDSIDDALAFYGRLFEIELRGRMRGMAFVDLGDQFIAFAEGRAQAPDGSRHFGLVVDDQAAVLAAAREAGRRDLRRQLVPRPVGEPRAGRRVLRHPVHQDARDPARHGARAREERVGAARARGKGSRLIDLSHHELFNLLVLLAAGATMLVLAPKLRVPYPIILVLGGLALGFVPGLPEIDLPPDLVLVGVLPLLLYGAAFFTSAARPARQPEAGRTARGGPRAPDDGRRRRGRARDRPRTAVGGGVRPRRRRLADRPDRGDGDHAASRRAAADRVDRRGREPGQRRTALVAYRVAVVAAVSGTFSLWEAGLSFVFNVLGGVAVGLAVGWVVRQVRRRLDFPPAEVTISLLTGYFAYIPAELIGVSAVIAAVTVGIYMGWYTPELTTPEVRLMGESAWEIVTFTLNAILFTLIGLQLPGILDELDAYAASDPALVGGGHLAHRARRPRALGLPGGQAPAGPGAPAPERDPMPPRSALALITWSGMRGAVSLAAALAIPLSTDAGEPFPAATSFSSSPLRSSSARSSSRA